MLLSSSSANSNTSMNIELGFDALRTRNYLFGICFIERCLITSKHLLENIDESILIINHLAFQILTSWVKINFPNRTVQRVIDSLRHSRLTLQSVFQFTALLSKTNCSIFLFKVLSFALINTIEKQILNISLFCIIKSLESSQFLIVFLFAIKFPF